MGSKLNASPIDRSFTIAKTKPKAATALALGVVAALVGGAFAAPASAKTSVQGGQNACKAAFLAQTPAPASVRIEAGQTRAQNDTLIFAYNVKAAADARPTTVTCTVDRVTNVATLTPEATAPTTLATR